MGFLRWFGVVFSALDFAFRVVCSAKRLLFGDEAGATLRLSIKKRG